MQSLRPVRRVAELGSFGIKSMKPKLAVWALCFHAGLLIVASTRLSVLSWIWGKHAWTWDYFQYAYQNGWGYKYQSDYSPAIVLLCIAAYLAGVTGYAMAWKFLPQVWPGLGGVLSALGLISFLIEGSHWLWRHNLSWVVSCPAASLLLAGGAIVWLGGTGSRRAEPSASPNGGPAAPLDKSLRSLHR